jgi:hypothetical protein
MLLALFTRWWEGIPLLVSALPAANITASRTGWWSEAHAGPVEEVTFRMSGRTSSSSKRWPLYCFRGVRYLKRSRRC